ncbi:MAG: hypothetical protein ACPG77_02525, partial [Nannocystaceae bacterium]
ANANHGEARAAATQAHAMYTSLGPAWKTAADKLENWLQTHSQTTPTTVGATMQKHIITLTNDHLNLISDKLAVDVSAGDTVELVNNSSLDVVVKFCEVASDDSVVECPSRLGPLAAGETHSGLAIPQTSKGALVNAIHVVAGQSWPKIMVRPIRSTGG